MTHPFPRFRVVAELSACASCLCLGSTFACGDTTTTGAHGATTNESTTAAGPTTTGFTTTGFTTTGFTTTGFTTTGFTTTGFTTTGFTTGTGGTSDCPSLEPSVGSECSVGAQGCIYANCTAPDYRDYHELSCSNGTWVLSLTHACQVGPCPDYQPLIGSYCDASVTPGPCSVVDPCGELREITCNDFFWKATDNKIPERPAGAEPPVCPAEPPYPSSSCCPAAVPERCDYRESATDGAAGASFNILPASTIGGAPPNPGLQCAVCTDQMYWSNCPQE